jgi:membrane peptidoglycan carboxypeptidase
LKAATGVAPQAGSARRRLPVVVGVMVVVAALVVSVIWMTTPSGADVQARVLSEASSRGVTLVAASAIPLNLSRGIVATEDERFYSHHGIDTIGLGRSLFDDLRDGCLCEGGSTITEQLVKQVYLNGSDRGWNKIVDVFVAFKVEDVIDKNQIMADYVSVVPTGPGLYGMTAASCAYFGRGLSELDLAQLALLAGLTQAPSVYDPLTNPRAATQRRSVVLGLMVSEHYITVAQSQAAGAEALVPSDAAAQGGC